MSRGAGPLRTIAVAGVCLALGAVAVAAMRAPEPRPAAARWPAPEELDSLARYLAPVEAAPRIDDYAAFLPAAAPPPAPYLPPAPAPVAAPRTEWRVSAILISGERPLAIVNDRQVRPGEPLPGGARVVSIGRDHVVIRESDGTQRTVPLAEGNEGPE